MQNYPRHIAERILYHRCGYGDQGQHAEMQIIFEKGNIQSKNIHKRGTVERTKRRVIR